MIGYLKGKVIIVPEFDNRVPHQVLHVNQLDSILIAYVDALHPLIGATASLHVTVHVTLLFVQFGAV